MVHRRGWIAAALIGAAIALLAPAVAKANRPQPGNGKTNGTGQSLVKVQCGKCCTSPSVTAVTPSLGSAGTLVTITGAGLGPVNAVYFGQQTAAFTHVNGSTITATVPANGPGSTVAVTAAYEGCATGASKASYTYTIGELSMEGPLHPTTCTDRAPEWTSPPADSSLAIDPPPTLTFDTLTPTFHITTRFVESGIAESPSGRACYVGPNNQGDFESFAGGNQGTYSATLEQCQLQPAQRAQKDGRCPYRDTDVHGNKQEGWWVPVDENAQDNLASNGGNYGNSSSGEIALPTTGLFDPTHLVATLRITAWISQTDTQNGSIEMTDTTSSDPFTVVILPAALVQLSAVPYTIIYHPPGDESTAKQSFETTYGTSLTIGENKEASNTTTVDNSESTKFSVKAAWEGVGFNGAWSSSWDKTTQYGFGTTYENTNEDKNSLGFRYSRGVGADNKLIPGDGKTCSPTKGGDWDCTNLIHAPEYLQRQPFWEDRFVLLAHPQFAEYVFGNGQDRSVMYGADPAVVEYTVRKLAACARGAIIHNQEQCSAQYDDKYLTAPNGGPVVYKNEGRFFTLSRAEAAHLLTLDPFYVNGQGGGDLGVDRALGGIPGGGPYGESNVEETPSLAEVKATNKEFKNSQTKAQQWTSSEITDVVGNEDSAGLSISKTLGGQESSQGEGNGGGKDGGPSVDVGEELTLSNSDKSTYKTAAKTTLSNSTAVSEETVAEAEAKLEDGDSTDPNSKGWHDPLPYLPTAEPYLDRLFGSLMYVDPFAPRFFNGPVVRPNGLVSPLLGQEMREAVASPHFADVRSGSALNGAIGLLAEEGIMSGLARNLFEPRAALTQEQLAAALARVGRLPLEVSSRAFTNPARPSQTAVSQRELASAIARAFGLSRAASVGLVRDDLHGFQGKRPVTRAQAAQVLFNVLNLRCPGSCRLHIATKHSTRHHRTAHHQRLRQISHPGH
jgi:hypothetical protein